MNDRTAIDDAIDKLNALLALVSSAQRAPTGTAPPAKLVITAQPAPTRPAVDVSTEPAVDGAQEQKQPQQCKKEKKAPKAPAPNAVPAASGEGLFYRAQLQIVKVLTVEDTDSTKLLKITIDLGNDVRRQVVAGLKGHVPAEQLQGSHAVAILNLKPAKLAGMASEAMLLAADAPKEDGTELVRVLVPPVCCRGLRSSAGDQVFLEGGAAPKEYAKTLKSDPWKSIVESLQVQGGKAVFEGKALMTAKGPITLPQEMPDGKHEPRHVPSHPLSHFCHTSTMGCSDQHKKGKPHIICASKAHKGPSKQDPLAVLGEDIVVVILGCLSAEDLARCTTVSKQWKCIALSDELWSRHCMELLRSCSHTKVSLLQYGKPPEDAKGQELDCTSWYSAHMGQGRRSQITREELCSFCWNFRFKRQAGEFWMSWDPYWTKSGPQMRRVFHEDGTVIGIPSHDPFWFQDSECRWRFTKSREGKRGGPFVKVNHWPSLVVSRREGFGWRMENCWVVYDSIDPEAQEAKQVLKKWEESQARRKHLAFAAEAY